MDPFERFKILPPIVAAARTAQLQAEEDAIKNDRAEISERIDGIMNRWKSTQSGGDERESTELKESKERVAYLLKGFAQLEAEKNQLLLRLTRKFVRLESAGKKVEMEDAPTMSLDQSEKLMGEDVVFLKEARKSFAKLERKAKKKHQARLGALKGAIAKQVADFNSIRGQVEAARQEVLEAASAAAASVTLDTVQGCDIINARFEAEIDESEKAMKATGGELKSR